MKLLTEGLRAELADTGVRVTLVLPGAVATAIKRNSGLATNEGEGKPSKAYPADRAARDTVDGVERNRERVLVGNDVKLLDVLFRLSPSRASAFINRMMQRHTPH